MKLSVCIPVYNFDVRKLVFDLKKEIEENNIEAEIILIDDDSDDVFKNINRELTTNVKNFIFLEKNIGRSAIRNLFLTYSAGDYLLFLDCDAQLSSQYFIRNYLKEIEQNNGSEVIYGNFKIDPQYSKTLRNRYSVEREIFSGEKSDDFSIFKTVNFIIKRSTFKKFPFNEELTHYGYEDYVFAKNMQLRRVKFVAINNPVMHIDDTQNDVFLSKTETAIDSLLLLSQNPKNEVLIKDIKLYKIAKRIKKMGFKPLFLFFYRFFDKKVTKNLLSENPKMNYLDFFKLELLLKKMR